MPHAKKRATTEGSSTMAPRGGLSQLSGTKSRGVDPFEGLASLFNTPEPTHTDPHSGFPPPPSTSFTPPLMEFEVLPPALPQVDPFANLAPLYAPTHTDPHSGFPPPPSTSFTAPPPMGGDVYPPRSTESKGGSSEDRMGELMEMQEKAALNSVAMQMAAARNNEIIAQGQTVQNASEMAAKASKAASSSTLGLL